MVDKPTLVVLGLLLAGIIILMTVTIMIGDGNIMAFKWWEDVA